MILAIGLHVCAESREDGVAEILGLSSGLSPAPLSDIAAAHVCRIAELDSRCFLLQFSLLFQRILIYLSAVLRNLGKMHGVCSLCTVQGNKRLPMIYLVSTQWKTNCGLQTQKPVAILKQPGVN